MDTTVIPFETTALVVDTNADIQTQCGSDSDSDSDGFSDGSDNCPTTSNPDQTDSDGDGTGDVCDTCENDPNNDIDGDGGCGDIDNCPTTSNTDQADANSDGIGDACATAVPPGTDVAVTPAPEIDITLDEATTDGDVTVTEIPDPAPPANFSLFGSAYDISTTAAVTGPITVCLSYDDTGLTQAEEDTLELLHFEGGSWVNITTSQDVVNSKVCGIASSLSPFVIGMPLSTASASNARFHWYRSAQCYEINFDASDNDGTTFEWDFGDGTTGSGKTTFHIYSKKGSYTVTLTVDGTSQRTMVVPARARNTRPTTSQCHGRSF